MKFGLIVRAYAPFPVFGLPPHEGDNRNATTSSDATSRVKAWVAFDMDTGKVELSHSKSDKSTMMLGLVDVSRTGTPIARVDHVKLGKGWLHFRLRAGGNVPTLKWVSPEINMHMAATFTVGSGQLNLTGELTGDQFPNFEVMLQDEKGTRRMVMTYNTSHNRWTGPEVNLWTDKKQPMNGICKSFAIDSSGRFV